MKALLLGSIGVLAETSELQRRAYNTAFVAHGIDWHWNIATYCRHLDTPGGQNRLQQSRKAYPWVTRELCPMDHTEKSLEMQHSM